MLILDRRNFYGSISNKEKVSSTSRRVYLDLVHHSSVKTCFTRFQKCERCLIMTCSSVLVLASLVLVTSAVEMSIDDLFVNEEDSEYESSVYKQLKELMDLDSDEVEKNIEEISEELRSQLDVIAKKGNTVIPQTSLSKIIKNNGRIPDAVARKVKKRGVLIVRHTVPTETIHQWMADLG